MLQIESSLILIGTINLKWVVLPPKRRIYVILINATINSVFFFLSTQTCKYKNDDSFIDDIVMILSIILENNGYGSTLYMVEQKFIHEAIIILFEESKLSCSTS